MSNKPVIDSSSRILPEDEAGKKEEILFQFLEFLPVGVFIMTSHGKPYYANQKAQQLLGRGIVGGTGPDQLAETYQAYVAGTDNLYPQEKMPIVRALKGESSTVEDMEIHKPEGKVMLKVVGAPIRDKEGRILYAVAAFTDLTEIAQTIRKLYEINDMLLRSKK